MQVSVNNKMDYSSIENLLKDNQKDAYAIASNDFSLVDGSLFFMPKDGSYKETGYVSNSIANANGNFIENPVITITLESGFTAFGMIMNFRNVAPQEFVIRTYSLSVLQDTYTVKNPDTQYITA